MGIFPGRCHRVKISMAFSHKMDQENIQCAFQHEVAAYFNPRHRLGMNE